MELGNLIWSGLVVSALFWLGWNNLFEAKRSRDQIGRTIKSNGMSPPVELPLLWLRIVGASMMMAAILSCAALVFEMIKQATK